MARLLVLLFCACVASLSFAQIKSDDSAGGAMHFSAEAIDLNGDGMISKDEFMQYHAAVWDKMTAATHGNMAVSAAAAAFVRGGMHIDASKMDSDQDGNISKDEFLRYEANHWSMLPTDARGQISVSDFVTAMKKHRTETAGVGAARAAKPD
jgi:hypothetical protein